MAYQVFARYGRGRINGLVTQALVMIGYVAAFDLGISALVPRDVARETGLAGHWQNSPDLRMVIAKWMKFAFLQIPLLAIMAMVGFYLLMRTNESNMIANGTVMSIAVLLVPLRLGGLIVNGLQDFHYEGIVQIVGYFVGVGVTVGLAIFYPEPERCREVGLRKSALSIY